MSRTRLLSSPAVLGASEKRFRWRFDFMGASRWFFSLSGTILLIGALALATQQLNFGIDFESGTRIKVALVKPTNEEGVRETLETVGISGEQVQRVSDPELGNNVFQIQTKALSPDKAKRALNQKFKIANGAFESTTVGPTFGEQVAESALKALIFSLLVICAYVAFRFDPKFAVPVLIALFHDILITAGVYSLTGKEVSSGTVAAFLTILGYSLYDTIIVFDRIRENMPRMPRAAFSQIVNRSMSEVLTRSLATSFTTLLAVTSLLVFGGTTLQDFAFAMLVGIASGTYSSIFIASPVLTAWKEREPGFARRRERIAELSGSVPAFADDVELAKLSDDSHSEGGVEDGAGAADVARESQPRPGAVATVEPEPGDDDGGPSGPSSNGEPTAAEIASAERREKNAARRARRQQRRKHGRNR
jgi:SecD/SecF fusion protein